MQLTSKINLPTRGLENNYDASFQKLSREELGNCRPVSLMSVLGKRVGSVIKPRTVKHVKEQRMLMKNQAPLVREKPTLLIF